MEERELKEDEAWVWAECRKGIEEVELLKSKDIKQKSQVKWATFGDDNTAYFYSVVNGRKARNSIPGLEVEGSGFLNLLRWLIVPFSREEIKAAVFECGVISRGCGSSFITLIPKVKNPLGLEDYRQITLIGIISKMGFPVKLCEWIKGILESARSVILVNGSLTFEFKCEKGLWQRDPLSPFLF
ncbi:uncharacterized protein LOC143546199 [Bidens hawaiensis]|uniref:uncharacterized protein LOC143546194 n=1 Tax=Bidens hawaiensis TaxID=980011 RepID=UPI00404AD05C